MAIFSPVHYAKQEIYKRNFIRFAEEQLKIKTIKPGVFSPFILNGGQAQLHRRIEEQHARLGYIRAILLKGRQLGGSTYSQARVFHRTVTYGNFNALLIALDEASTSKIFDISRTFFDLMNDEFRPMIRNSNKKELVFENPDKRLRNLDPGLKSRMDFQSQKQIQAGTGTTRQALHLSECAKWEADNIETLTSSLMPTIHLVPGTMIIEESTAYHQGHHFREMCEYSRSDKSEYVFCFVPWWLDAKNQAPLAEGEKIVPNAEERRLIKLASKGQPRDDVPPLELLPTYLKWRRIRLGSYKRIGAEFLFEQEYPSTFESAWVAIDDEVFPRDVMQDMRKSLVPPTRYVEMQRTENESYRIATIRKESQLRTFKDDEYVAFWEEPEHGVIYDLGADVGVGTPGGDWSTATIFRRDTNVQVAEYHKHIDPRNFGDELYWLGKYFNNAQIGIEMNGPGYATGNRLAQLMYPYIYRWRHRERDAVTFSTYAGWKTQRDSKHLMVTTARHHVAERSVEVRSHVLWDEMRDFMRVGQDEYRGIGHDDLVMAFCITEQIAEDEKSGVPPAPPAEKKASVISAAYQDSRDFRAPRDRTTSQILSELNPKW